MNDDDIEDGHMIDFLLALDAICAVAIDSGMSSAGLAGAMLARVQHLYLMDGQADLEGLERLLRVALDNIASRPRFDIE